MEKPNFLSEAPDQEMLRRKVDVLVNMIDSRFNVVFAHRDLTVRHWEHPIEGLPVAFDFIAKAGVRAIVMEYQGRRKSIVIDNGKAVLSGKSAASLLRHLGDRKFRSVIDDTPTANRADLEEFIDTYRYVEHQSLIDRD